MMSDSALDALKFKQLRKPEVLLDFLKFKI